METESAEKLTGDKQTCLTDYQKTYVKYCKN